MPSRRSTQSGETLGFLREAHLKRPRFNARLMSRIWRRIESPSEVVLRLTSGGRVYHGVLLLRCIGAAECVGRETTNMYLQAFYFYVAMMRGVPHLVWRLRLSTEDEILDHLQDFSLSDTR